MHAEGSAADVVMLDFDGMRVLSAGDVDGELEVVVETTAEQDWCRGCGARAYAHQRVGVRRETAVSLLESTSVSR